MKKVMFIVELVLTIGLIVIGVRAYNNYSHAKIVDPLFKDNTPASEYNENICGVYSNGSYHLYINYMNNNYNVELKNNNDIIAKNYVNINTNGENIYYIPLVGDEENDCTFINIDTWVDGNIRVYVNEGKDDTSPEYYYLSKDNESDYSTASNTADLSLEETICGVYTDDEYQLYIDYKADTYLLTLKDNNKIIAENSATLDENSESILVSMYNAYPYIEVIGFGEFSGATAIAVSLHTDDENQEVHYLFKE